MSVLSFTQVLRNTTLDLVLQLSPASVMKLHVSSCSHLLHKTFSYVTIAIPDDHYQHEILDSEVCRSNLFSNYTVGISVQFRLQGKVMSSQTCVCSQTEGGGRGIPGTRSFPEGVRYLWYQAPLRRVRYPWYQVNSREGRVSRG